MEKKQLFETLRQLYMGYGEIHTKGDETMIMAQNQVEFQKVLNQLATEIQAEEQTEQPE